MHRNLTTQIQSKIRSFFFIITTPIGFTSIQVLSLCKLQ